VPDIPFIGQNNIIALTVDGDWDIVAKTNGVTFAAVLIAPQIEQVYLFLCWVPVCNNGW
jgi:hypothetical protein